MLSQVNQRPLDSFKVPPINVTATVFAFQFPPCVKRGKYDKKKKFFPLPDDSNGVVSRKGKKVKKNLKNALETKKASKVSAKSSTGQAASKEAPKDVSKEAAKNAAEQVSKEAAKNAAEQVAKEVAKETAKQVAKQAQLAQTPSFPPQVTQPAPNAPITTPQLAPQQKTIYLTPEQYQQYLKNPSAFYQ